MNNDSDLDETENSFYTETGEKSVKKKDSIIGGLLDEEDNSKDLEDEIPIQIKKRKGFMGNFKINNRTDEEGNDGNLDNNS